MQKTHRRPALFVPFQWVIQTVHNNAIRNVNFIGPVSLAMSAIFKSYKQFRGIHAVQINRPAIKAFRNNKSYNK